MRIAMVSLHTSPLDIPGHGDAGGLNVYVTETANALARRGHRIEVFTRATSPSEVGTVVLDSGVKVHRLIAGPCAPIAKNDLVDVVAEFAVSMNDFGPFDVVHSHYWLSGLAVLRSEWSMPHVQTFHTTARMKAAAVSAAVAADADVRADAEQEICDSAAMVCCVSDAEAESLTSLYRVDRSCVGVVRPGVDAELFRRRGARIRRQWRVLQRIPLDAFVVATAGRVQPLKGQMLLAEAISRVDPGLGVFGVVIGDPTPGHEAYFAELQERVGEADLAARFASRGAVTREQLAMWFAVYQVVAVPSSTESFGLTSLEAQSAGAPVIARNVGGLPETLIDGETGILIDSDDPDDWAAVITQLATDSPRRAALGRAAHTFAREHSWDAAATQLEHFYTSLD